MAKQQPPVKKITKAPKEKAISTAKPFQFDRYLQWLHLLIISIVFWVVYSNIFDHKPDMNGDNFAYILLGKRLAAGLGFTNATSIKLTPHNHFSPGYPAMIALFIKTIGDDQDTFSFMNGVMMYLSVVLMYFITKRLSGSAALGFAVAFMCSVNSILLRFSTITMSEIPYLFISTLAIFLFVLAVQEKTRYKDLCLFLSILMMAYAYYIKSNAISFIVAAGAYFLFTRDWKRMLIAGAGVTLIIFPWYLRTKKVGSSYMDQLKFINPYKPELGKITTSTMIDRVYHNMVRYLTCDIPLNIFPSDTTFDKAPLSYWLLGLTIAALTIWGLYKLKDLRIYLLAYMGGAIAVLMIWPTEYGFIRYMTPFTPLIVMLAFNGLKELFALALQPQQVRFVPYAFILLGLVYSKPITAAEEQAAQPMPANYVNYFDAAKWAKANTPPGAIFSARKPDMFVYYSDRLCIGDKPSLDDKEVMDYFRENKVDYVVIEQLGFASTAKFLVPAVQKNPDKFDLVLHLENPDTYVLKFKR